MNSLSDPAKFWATLAVTSAVVLLFAVADFLSINFVYQSWDVLIQAREELAEVEARRVDVNSAAHALSNLGQEQKLIEASFPDLDNPLPFIENIEALGRRLGVNAKIDSVSEASGGSQARYSILVNGTFGNTISFLSKLESAPFFIHVEQIEMARSGFADSGGKRAPAPQVLLKINLRTVAP